MYKMIILLLIVPISIFASNLSNKLQPFVQGIVCDHDVVNDYYEICYNEYNRGAVYSYYSLQKVDIVNISKRPAFYTDVFNLSIPNLVFTNEYIHLGYDRGHIASDASFDYSEDSLHAVYSMINITPQTPQLNRIAWKKTEIYERELAKSYKVNILVLINYDNTFINNLSIPILFTKIFEYNNVVECYQFNNVFDKAYNKQPLEKYKVNCDDIKY